METTTLVTFLLGSVHKAGSVDLFGSWDNFSKPHCMQKDRQKGHGTWFGTHTFSNIICDGDPSEVNQPRDGALRMGGTYWYFYRRDGDLEFHNHKEPSTTDCPLLPGQRVNVLEVPHVSFESMSTKSADLWTALAFTLNPMDRFLTPKPTLRPQEPRVVNASRSSGKPHVQEYHRRQWFHESLGRLQTAAVDMCLSTYANTSLEEQSNLDDDRRDRRVKTAPTRDSKWDYRTTYPDRLHSRSWLWKPSSSRSYSRLSPEKASDELCVASANVFAANMDDMNDRAADDYWRPRTVDFIHPKPSSTVTRPGSAPGTLASFSLSTKTVDEMDIPAPCYPPPPPPGAAQEAINMDAFPARVDSLKGSSGSWTSPNSPQSLFLNAHGCSPISKISVEQSPSLPPLEAQEDFLSLDGFAEHETFGSQSLGSSPSAKFQRTSSTTSAKKWLPRLRSVKVKTRTNPDARMLPVDLSQALSTIDPTSPSDTWSGSVFSDLEDSTDTVPSTPGSDARALHRMSHDYDSIAKMIKPDVHSSLLRVGEYLESQETIKPVCPPDFRCSTADHRAYTHYTHDHSHNFKTENTTPFACPLRTSRFEAAFYEKSSTASHVRSESEGKDADPMGDLRYLSVAII